MARILIADDDEDIRRLLTVLLTEGGYQVIQAADGIRAVELFDEQTDLVVLDMMMPGMTGLEACEAIRKRSTVPILFLTAKGQEYDKIFGFSAGADDYLVKPFHASELLARIKAMLRRYREYGGRKSGETPQPAITMGGLSIDTEACRVTVNGEEKALTATEYRVLLLLCETPGKVFSAENIFESVWGERYYDSSNNTIMVHIRKLREKIEADPGNPRYLKTVWGMGYKADRDA